MANSRIGQYRLEFTVTGFTSPTREHVVGLWVAPLTNPPAGALPNNIDVQLKGGGSDNLQNVANSVLDFFRPLYAASVSLGAFTLWRYATETARDFVTAGAATTSVAGIGAVEIASQTTLTFRHANGGIGKVVIIEGNRGGSAQVNLVPSPTGTPQQKLAAYLLSASSPMIALDNSFPVAPLRISDGQNEKIWRKIFRQ